MTLPSIVMPSVVAPETPTPSPDDFQKRIAELEAKLKEQETKHATSLRVSEKGCVSLYGMRRMPITFYAQEWMTLFEKAEDILNFIEANREALSWKD
jgi:DNA recombination-dependent growth factor C